MPTDTVTLSKREAFEKGTIALSPAVTQELKLQPTEQPSASAQTEQTESQPTADTSDNIDAVDSSTTADASGDEPVDSSAATDEADASDDSDTVDSDDANADQQPPRPQSRSQRRIEDLVASNKALKASLDYLQNQVLTKLPQQQPTAPAAPTVAVEAAPTLESCGYDTDKWTREMHSWTAKQIEQGVSKAVQTVQQNQTEASRKAAFEKRLATFQAATPDLQVVLGNPALPQLHKDAAALVVDSDVGPQILYHLGKNPEKAARIARQTAVQQAAAIGRLEAELSVKQTSAQKNTTKNITRAPSPPTPTKGNSGAPSTDPTKMPIKDYIARERAQLAQKRTGR